MQNLQTSQIHWRRVLRKTFTVFQIITTALALGVLCGYFVQKQMYAEDNTNLDRIQVVRVTLDDTRKVPCVVQGGYIRTCDWMHSSGSDYMD